MLSLAVHVATRLTKQENELLGKLAKEYGFSSQWSVLLLKLREKFNDGFIFAVNTSFMCG